MYRELKVELDSFDCKILENMTDIQLARFIILAEDSCNNPDFQKTITIFKPVLNTIFRQLKRGISNAKTSSS